MTVMSLDGKKQPATGKKDHWRPFSSFQQTDLHDEFIKLIEVMIPSDTELFSSQLGAEILSKIQKNKPELLSVYKPSQVGSLFGMTLWHYLATLDDTWHFYNQAKNDSNGATGKIYFRADT